MRMATGLARGPTTRPIPTAEEYPDYDKAQREHKYGGTCMERP